MLEVRITSRDQLASHLRMFHHLWIDDVEKNLGELRAAHEYGHTSIAPATTWKHTHPTKEAAQ